jgi:hypothetical protein
MTQRQGKAATIRMAAHPVPPEEVIANGIAGVPCPPGIVKLEYCRGMHMDRGDNAEVPCMTCRLVLPSGAIPDLLRMLTDLTQGRKVG